MLVTSSCTSVQVHRWPMQPKKAAKSGARAQQAIVSLMRNALVLYNPWSPALTFWCDRCVRVEKDSTRLIFFINGCELVVRFSFYGHGHVHVEPIDDVFNFDGTLRLGYVENGCGVAGGCING